MTMSFSEMKTIVDSISYKPGWKVNLYMEEKSRGEGHWPSLRPYLQLSVSVESDATLDSHKRDGTRTPWKSGKRYLSEHMCNQEIVGQAFDLIKAAEMHEVHEWFRYRNASIYNPHLNPDVLVEVARKASSFITRENAMSMEENLGD